MELLIFLAGAAAGALAAWFIARLKSRGLAAAETLALNRDLAAKEQLAQGLQERCAELKAQVVSFEQESLRLNKELSARQQNLDHLNERLASYKKEVEEMQKMMKIEFENIANKILEERSRKFLENSSTTLSSVLHPLKENILDFKQRVEHLYGKEMEERLNLKAEIRNLMGLNQQLSADANNLANALKGESKTQGSWGEAQLELILEKAGLLKNTHYRLQESFESGDGSRLQPDCIINLPEKKHLVIDSKVSLTAFERYFNAGGPEEKELYLKQHLESLVGHIKELGKKNYQGIHQITQPDFVLMFIAYESALALALKENTEIFTLALEKNIVLVTGSTLLATLRTVSYIWKQENQKHNVLEIAKQGGALYDKFVSFVDDLKKIGESIDAARDSHAAAMNKLTESVKKGDTLVGRAERLRSLGAPVSKALPPDLIGKADAGEQLSDSPDAD